MNTNYKLSIHFALVPVFVAGCFLLLVPQAFAVSGQSCVFNRDLQMGVVGEDVRCLQQYLNANGYIISTTGAGAPGKETGEFKSLTQAAVIKWQIANNLSPASGYFGPKSQQVYQALLSGGTVIKPTIPPNPVNTPPAPDALMKQILELQQNIKEQTKTTPVASGNASGIAIGLASELKSVTMALRDAEEEVADNDDAEDYDDSLESLIEARDYYYRAVLAYLSGDAEDTKDHLSEVEGYIEDALDSVGVESDKTEAEDALDDVKDELDEAEEEVEEADKAGKTTSKSEDLLEEASDVIDEAEDALGDKDFDEVLDLVEEAEDLIDEALDAIGDKKKGGDDVEDMLDDARKELKSVRKEVDAAIDDGDKVGDAEDYLDEAEDLLDDAESAIDDGDEDEAEDLIDEALDLIADAEDEL